MANIMVKTTNWIKGFALLGMMVALVGMLAVAPGAYAAPAPIASDPAPVPIISAGKLSLVARGSDGLTRHGIADAKVIVRPDNSDVIVLEGKTDLYGRFVGKIAPGSYQVTVAAEGYKTFVRYVKVSANDTTSLTASLERDVAPPPTDH